jgi:hypothetical protein
VLRAAPAREKVGLEAANGYPGLRLLLRQQGS